MKISNPFIDLANLLVQLLKSTFSQKSNIQLFIKKNIKAQYK